MKKLEGLSLKQVILQKKIIHLYPNLILSTLGIIIETSIHRLLISFDLDDNIRGLLDFDPDVIYEM